VIESVDVMAHHALTTVAARRARYRFGDGWNQQAEAFRTNADGHDTGTETTEEGSSTPSCRESSGHADRYLLRAASLEFCLLHVAASPSLLRLR
jgi:hypothetical protein